ncbi:MAG: N-(5'-phosphoribosyl)anthranilate isomerase [Anaerolineaceae bacterium]|nr:N-(5'-phosphoribosyl)anthranilate isomerase [Anaerolineaceae bacterium]
MTYVKICGVTTYRDALMSAKAGADLLGLNFYAKSPRYISPEDAATLCRSLRSALDEDCPVLVGVFVNATVDEVARTIQTVGLDFAQLSGDESLAMVAGLLGRSYKAIRPDSEAAALDDANYYAPHFPSSEQVPSLLVDAYHPNLYGGTGEQASESVVEALKQHVPRLMLAGGLNPGNVGERVASLHPWGVDVASGVEDGTPGVKSEAKVKAFIDAAKGAS